jgi:hypothetical protein
MRRILGAVWLITLALLTIMYTLVITVALLPVLLFGSYMVFAMSMDPAKSIQSTLHQGLLIEAISMALVFLSWFSFTRTLRRWGMILMRVTFVFGWVAVIAASLALLVFWGITHIEPR